MNAARGADRRRRVARVTVTMAVLAAALLVAGSTAVQTRVEASATDAAPSGGTLRVAMVMNPDSFVGFDPQEIGDATESAVLGCCLQRTLMAFPGVLGYQGLQPHPDLAAAAPTVSTDGLTWTFHIRPGVHYAPPLNSVEVTSGDFVRAFARALRMPQVQAYQFQSVVVGAEAFARRDTGTISGVRTPDARTLQIDLLHPEPDLDQILALPWSVPLPPDLASSLLKGTAGALSPGEGPDGGYGMYQAATGPYMFEGADQTDYGSSNTPTPPSGYDEPSVPADGSRLLGGSYTLVRNPSWQQRLDPVRPAYPDRIVITIESVADAYAALHAGQVDTVIGASPTPSELRDFNSPTYRERTTRFNANGTVMVMLNQVQPPFDDPAMRRRFAAALDAQAVQRSLESEGDSVEFGNPPSHLIPDPLIDELLAHWQGPRTHEPMSGLDPHLSGSAGHRGCSHSACPQVRFGVFLNGVTVGPVTREISEALRAIGLQPRFKAASDTQACLFPDDGYAACLVGWTGLNAGSWLDVMFSPTNDTDGVSWTGMGMTPRALQRLGFPQAEPASIEHQQDVCLATISSQSAPCWARLDQWLTDRVVAAVPVATYQRLRLAGDRVARYSVDQANLEVALNKVKLSDSSG